MIFLLAHVSVALVAVEHRPHPNLHPALSAALQISTSDPATRILRVSGVDSAGMRYEVNSREFPQTFPGLVKMFGLRANASYYFEVESIHGDAPFVNSVNFSTPNLEYGNSAPGKYPGPKPIVEKANVAAMAPGWTWWSALPGGNHSAWAGSTMIDARGDVRWFADCSLLFKNWWPKVLDPALKCGLDGTQTKMSNGNLLIMWSLNQAMVSKDGLVGILEVNGHLEVQRNWVSYRDMTDKWKPYIPDENSSNPAILVDAYTFNHDIRELENGDLAVICFENRLVKNCQKLEDDDEGVPPAAGTNVTGNEVVEFSPADGKISKRFSTFDALSVCDTYQIGAGPVDVDSAEPVGQPDTGPEWIHMNSVDYKNTKTRNELIMSSFAKGWVWAVRYEADANGPAGSLLWVLGYPATQPLDEAIWWKIAPTFLLANASDPTGLTSPNHFQPGQHNANIVSADGNQLLFFDNGAKAAHKTMNSSSRLVQFDITRRPTLNTSCADISATCAAQLANGSHCAGPNAQNCRKSCGLCWVPGVTKIVFDYTPGGKSPFLGGARKLENGNYLGNFGALTYPVCDSPCQMDFVHTCLHAKVVEVTEGGDVVFDARIGGEFEGECRGWNAYRAERLSANETFFTNTILQIL